MVKQKTFGNVSQNVWTFYDNTPLQFETRIISSGEGSPYVKVIEI